MTPADFRTQIAALGFTQRGFAIHVGANERTVRRWADETQDIPNWVPVLLAAMERVRALEATREAALAHLANRDTRAAVELLSGMVASDTPVPAQSEALAGFAGSGGVVVRDGAGTALEGREC